MMLAEHVIHVRSNSPEHSTDMVIAKVLARASDSILVKSRDSTYCIVKDLEQDEIGMTGVVRGIFTDPSRALDEFNTPRIDQCHR